MVGDERGAQASPEPTLKYHPWYVWILTFDRYPAKGQYLVGSLTGAVTSQRVTEVSQGLLSVVGNHT